jgi:hypothetical protein
MNPRPILTAITSTHTTTGAAGVDAQRVDSSAHDEWLLDEALGETFPASDPISPSSRPMR